MSAPGHPPGAPWWASVSRSQWYALLAAHIGYALDAFDVMLYSFALKTIMAEWSLSASWAGAMVSVTLFFSSLGGVVFGLVADRLGRKRAMMITVLLFSACSGLSGLAQNAWQLMLARAVLGLGMGGEWTAGALLIAESWPAQHRGKAIGIMQSGWAVGYILAAIAANLVLPALGWRVLFFIGVTPALFTVWLRARLTEPAIAASRSPPERGGWGQALIRPLKRDLLRLTLSATLVSGLVMSAYWGLFTWIPGYFATPVESGGIGLSLAKAPIYTIPVMAGAFAGYVSFGFVSDSLGRRRTFAAYLSTACVLVFALATINTPNALLMIGPWLGFFGSGYFSAFGTVLAEIFPTDARAVGLGLSYNTGRMLSAGAPALIGYVADRGGFFLALSLIAATFAVAAAAVFLLPETRGRRLDAAQVQ